MVYLHTARSSVSCLCTVCGCHRVVEKLHEAEGPTEPHRASQSLTVWLSASPGKSHQARMEGASTAAHCLESSSTGRGGFGLCAGIAPGLAPKRTGTPGQPQPCPRPSSAWRAEQVAGTGP